MGHARWVDMNMPPVLDSVDEDMTFLIVLHMMCMGALCIVLGCLTALLLRIYQAAAWECDFGKTRYAEPDSKMRIMPLA